MHQQSWTTARARCELEKLLDRPITEEHWEYLVDEKYVEELEYWDVPEDRAKVLALSYRTLLRTGVLEQGRKVGDRRTPFRMGEEWLSPDEMTLAAAIGEAMAQRAKYIPEIAEHHGRLSDGSLRITAEQVRQMWDQAFDDDDLETRRNFATLARCFDWHLEDAAIFVLAGWVAPVDPLVASVTITEYPDEHGTPAPRSRARITLEFDPWVSLDTISHAYWSLRRRLIGAERKPPQAREIEAFRFVLRHLDERGNPRTSWSEIGRLWNERHAADGWRYSKPGDIKRPFNRIRECFINYQYPDVFPGDSQPPVPTHGRERGERRRVMIDPQERTPDDQVSPGGSSRRVLRRMPEKPL